MSNLKIIFLDIDGVLNSSITIKEEVKDIDGEYYFYEDRLVDKLNYIVENTGAKIVVSSTWRLGVTLDHIKYLLSRMGVLGEIIDMTPDLMNSYICRGNEIQKWVIDNEDLLGYSWHREFTSYVILDDDSDMLYDQKDNFVHTKGHLGLTDDDARLAINILNNPRVVESYF